MKALRYLLIVMSLVSVLSIGAQTLAQQPKVQMTSTSIMAPSGSTLPQAATTGAMMTGSTPGTYTPAKAPSRPRKGWGSGEGGEPGSGGESGEPGDWHEPYEDPLGDVMWPLMLLAGAFAFGKWLARTKPLR